MFRPLPACLFSPLGLLLLLLLLSGATDAASCETYTGTVCQNYFQGNKTVYISLLSQPVTESILIAEGVQNLTILGGAIDPFCAEAAGAFGCGTAYASCSQPTAPLCQYVCQRFVDQCSDILESQNLTSSIPDCSGYAQQNCRNYTFQDTLPEGFSCPDPLILIPNFNITSPYCVGVCCVPCPAGDYFYPKNHFKIEENFITAFILISFLGCCYTVISYIAIPEKRRYPQVIICCMAFALVLFYVPMLGAIPDRNVARCVDSITPSSPGGQQNPLCLTISILAVYGMLSAALWYLLLVINVYFNVVLLSQKMIDYAWLYQFICWGLPLISVIVSVSLNKTGYIFGNWCLLDFGIFLDAALMIPLGVITFSSVLLNLLVLIRIARVGRRRNASFMQILQLQIRFFAFVLVVLVIFLYYWLNYEVHLAHLDIQTSAPWVKNWFTCVAEGLGQDVCAEVAQPNLPNFGLYAVAESVIALLGMVVVCFFGFKKEVLVFWYEVVTTCNWNRFRDASFSTIELKNSKSRSTQKSESQKTDAEKEKDKDKDKDLD